MVWEMNHPLLYCLPIMICLLIHVFISSGLILDSKPGFYRFLLYLTSSAFMLIYLVLFNHGMTQATTRVVIYEPGKYLSLENQYGSVRIPRTDLQYVVVEGSLEKPRTVWIISKEQTFYLDENFTAFEDFLPRLSGFVELENTPRTGTDNIFWVGPGKPPSTPLDLNSLSSKNNYLQGNTNYYLSWLLLFSILAYRLCLQAWSGNPQYFIVYFLLYTIPLIVLAFFLGMPPSILGFCLLYCFYLPYLTAMCIRRAEPKD